MQLISRSLQLKKLAVIQSSKYLYSQLCLRRTPLGPALRVRVRPGGGGGTWVFFGWVCAARDSKLAPCSKEKFPYNRYPALEMGHFFILRSGCNKSTTVFLLMHALNRIFKSNLSLNNFKWLLTKLKLSCVCNIISRSRKCL